MKDPPERWRRGRAAEEIAAAHIQSMGMQVLARNVRVHYLELDIVARDGPCVVVVEVRTRGAGAWVASLDSVSAVKRKRLRRAAQLLWKRRWSKWRGIDRVRFDVAAVDLDAPGGPEVNYLRAAF